MDTIQRTKLLREEIDSLDARLTGNEKEKEWLERQLREKHQALEEIRENLEYQKRNRYRR